jgi:TonB family protein
MTTRALEFDLPALDREQLRDRTGWSMATSVMLHALLLLMLILLHHSSGPVETLTEITLLEPGTPESAPAAPGAAAAPAAGPHEAGVVRSQSEDAHFLRRNDPASIAPDPQSNTVADRLDARLASMREDQPVAATNGSVTGAPSALWSTPAGVPNSTGSSGTRQLSRGEGLGSAPALPLGRGGGLGSSTALAADVGMPQQIAHPAAAPQSDANVHRSLAGASLTGPVANRPVLHMVTPIYPEWAKHDGVEATVTLSFIVRPDGVIKENVLVQKTAGFAEFDDSARAALSQWLFKPLKSGETGEQWGTITFRFRLRDS